MKIDAIDQMLIDELVRDARTPLAALAEKVHLSRQSVRNRIDRLEGLKVIKGYTVRLGRPPENSTARAVILVYRKDRMRGADVITAISRIPEVTYCAVMSGEVDLLVHIDAISNERVSEIWNQISAMEGVQNTTTCFVLSCLVDKSAEP
ncbi:Lrp/AsnC family transcriptional regulator [Paraburkholderia xenovorans]|uniref:Lrp/AsnC family transcriptional regulator n=1 Tax=Paraburkholderia xenovorans TaxID=36873 RepID=UPI0038B7BF61